LVLSDADAPSSLDLHSDMRSTFGPGAHHQAWLRDGEFLQIIQVFNTLKGMAFTLLLSCVRRPFFQLIPWRAKKRDRPLVLVRTPWRTDRRFG
jgi:hypothetical protein